MAEWKDRVEFDIASFDVIAATCATRLREKYTRHLDDVSVSLIAVVVADYVDDLRKELFTYDHI